MTTGPREVPQPNQGWPNRIWLMLISLMTIITRSAFTWIQNRKTTKSTNECKQLHVEVDPTRTGQHKEQPLDSEIQNKPASIEQTESSEVAVDNLYKKCMEVKTGESGDEGAA